MSSPVSLSEKPGGRVESSTSSESETSEDEEEKKRIAAAVGDNAIVHLYNSAAQTDSRSSPSGNQLKTGSKTGPTQMVNGQKNTLKSNRPVDRNDDDKDNVLQTTPEFRAHVAKHLSSIMERKVSESLGDSVWKMPAKPVDTDQGIKLFSDSQRLFKLPNPDQLSDNSEKTQKVERKKKRKVRLSSSSSESSEDEKINSCVITASDIHQENERLSGLEVTTGSMTSGIASKQEVKGSNQVREGQGSGEFKGQDSSVLKKKKKKSKKKKKKLQESDVT